jgi:hypothetical protein
MWHRCDAQEAGAGTPVLELSEDLRMKNIASTSAVAVGLTVAVAATAMGSASAAGSAGNPATWASVSVNAKAVGVSAPNVLSPVLAEHVVAQGSMPLDGATAEHPYYGYLGDGPMLPAFGSNAEASKTEPDKNTYLVLKGQTGADPAGAYGQHFLFQGHEKGGHGYLTRVNLDADQAHRITLMASTFVDGTTLPDWDGSTWNPFAKRLLLTAEGTAKAGMAQATLDHPAKVVDLASVVGRAGYEGVQNDNDGNVWLVDDSSGPTVATSTRIPGGFIYRFVPVDKTDLTKGGKLQALQVTSNLSKQPISYLPADATNPTGGALTEDQKQLASYGTSFSTTWVTVHDTAVDTSGVPFDANLAARTAGATPFKRPENGVFRPSSGFKEFFFTATGDTNANSTGNTGFGGYGGIFKLRQADPSADKGTLTLVYAGDKEHTGFDNIQFLSDRHLAIVEDAGDTLHTQRKALDSGYVLDTRTDYSTGVVPARFLAEGRDPSATVDSGLSGSVGFQNDGDNEITGIHVSDGDATAKGILGAKVPSLFEDGWRLFWTQQHGDDNTWEITPRS